MNRSADHAHSLRKNALALLLLSLFVLNLFAIREASAQQSPEQLLAEKYSPILKLKHQDSNCDRSGEGYFPTSVDWLWNNQDISLKIAGDGDPENDALLKTAPTAQDLAIAGPKAYLDFPGDPRNPDCTFEHISKQKLRNLALSRLFTQRL